MKKIFAYSFAAVFAVFAVSCQSENLDPQTVTDEQNQPVQLITETITATVDEGNTKATVDADAKFAWTAGDHIAVHVSKDDDHKYVFTSAAGASGASASEASASFTVVYEEGYARDAFAVFPASIVTENAANYGQSGQTLDVTLPATYELSAVSGENTPCPMIATNAPGSGWEFKQLCGLLRLTVKAIPSDATGLVIQFPGKKVNGGFSVTDFSTATPYIPVGGSPADGEDKITVTFTAGTATEMTLNIPLPAGSYDDVYITPQGSATRVAAVRHIKAGGYTAARAHGKQLTATLVSFSVSDSKKVVFAPGNLQYIGSADTPYWKFADHQYDYLGTTTGQNSTGTNKDRDLFGWATSGYSSATTSDATWVNYQPWATSMSEGSVTTNKYEYGPSTNNIAASASWNDASHNATWKVCDWGHNAILNGGNTADTWRTLTSAEWLYLFGMESSGTDASGHARYRKYFRATVNSVLGIVVLPDDISGISNIPEESSRGTASTFGGKTYTTAEWTTLEAAGCVFLPAAGKRNGTTVDEVGSLGVYWSSTAYGIYYAYSLYFNSSSMLPTRSAGYRYFGYSVRLVRDVE